MLIFNERVLSRRVGPHNIIKFQQVLTLSSLMGDQIVR